MTASQDARSVAAPVVTPQLGRLITELQSKGLRVEQGYKVYCDTTWTIGFGARWLMTEIEKRGVGEDRVLFASDEPWSDFWSEYWKINGAPVSDELKQRIMHRNFEQLYGVK